jgi:hypothetical protein
VQLKLNRELLPIAHQLHDVSRVGDDRRGPGQSLEAYLSDMLTVAIIDRAEMLRKPPGREESDPCRECLKLGS